MVDLESLRQIEDSIQRARSAGEAQDELRDLSVEVSRIRREAIEDLLRDGMTKTAIASELGMTRGRVGQLVASGPAPERLFFGDGCITVPLGGKLEAGKDRPGQVLAEEDVRTFAELTEYLRHLQLDVKHEIVPPPGLINLNRDNLFVICGPRLSPIVGQILESDPFLGFGHDEEGWHLVNKASGEVIRSPQDAGEPGDVAYLGRLPRPDGRGFFLYAAGVHAAGPAGVVHYLRHNLPTLYRTVKRRRFSVLVSSTWDPNTRDIVSSKAVSELFIHENR